MPILGQGQCKTQKTQNWEKNCDQRSQMAIWSLTHSIMLASSVIQPEYYAEDNQKVERKKKLENEKERVVNNDNMK